MPKTILNFLLALGLLAASQQACAGAAPGIPTLDPNALDTAIAGTMGAASTETAQVVSLLVLPTSTVTPTKTVSPSPFPTFTPVVVGARVYVSKSMHCRAGPGEIYNSIGALKAGESARVVGRSADAKYWIIYNPKNPKELCWISGKYATVTGVAGAVPIFTPPPTPKPTRTPKPPTKTPKPSVTPTPPMFKAAYSDTINCTGTEWYVLIKLTNISKKVTFRSIGLGIEDPAGPFADILVSDDFINTNGCSTDTVDTLPPGATQTVSLPALPYDPAGHKLKVAILLCPKTGQNGTCAADVITFKSK